ncbi:MAG TPA: hypothetical protein VG847_04190 [Chitinophagaceae bacterium]|nr:hypothetical protein [Chitinophagaceae bacterium]
MEIPQYITPSSKKFSHRRSYIGTLLHQKCNHCRQGDLFQNRHSYSKGFMKMNERCPVCGHPTEIEVGFYYGTGYVSYALAIVFSIASFIIWYIFIGVSVDDNRLFYWLGANALLIILLQPYLMRLSRTLWYSFFVKYNANWQQEDQKSFERVNESLKNEW